MMIEKAIEIVTNAVQTEKHTAKQDKALAMVQKAVEKQISKKPVNISNFLYTCPTCEIVLIESAYYHSYCRNCGQALDWGDTNEM